MNVHRRPATGMIAPAIIALFALGNSTAFAADQGQVGAGKAPDPMQIARGARAWADNCGRCHNLRAPKEFSAKSWDVIVSQMRVRANLPGQVARDILAFLKASN